jgi:predicted NUDIX family phosphoesterase
LDVGRFSQKFLAMSYAAENVLVIRRSLFDELGCFHGLNFEPEKYLKAILSRGSNFFIERQGAENDPAYKQIIPYALIAFGNTVLHYVRGKKAGEQRLVAKGSIGIGGHMNETDESLFAMDEQAYRAGVEREVNEEIKIETPFEDRIVALLNDDSTEVGRVHLGIVHIFTLKEPRVQKREAMITGLGFLTKQDLVARRESLETWSQICVDALDKLLP